MAQAIPIADPKNYMLFNLVPSCALSEALLVSMREKLNLPSFTRIRPFEEGVDNINNPGPTRLIIWYGQVIAGLRLLIPEFFIRVANHFRIPINQLTTALIRRAAGFCILTRASGHSDPAHLFYETQHLKRSPGLPLYYFYTITGGRLTFLGKPQSSYRKNYETKFAVAELDNSQAWAQYLGLRQECWVSEKRKLTTPSFQPTSEDEKVINKLICLYAARLTAKKPIDLKKLSKNPSALHFAGLFE